jgi:hypothetical protein
MDRQPPINVFRKILSYCFLFIFLFNTMGFQIVFELNRFMVRKEMQKRVREGTLSSVLLKVSDPGHNPDFKRIDDKEVRYGGVLYDVITETRAGDITLFYCLQDQNEDELQILYAYINKKSRNVTLLEHMITLALPVFTPGLVHPFPEKVCYPRISLYPDSIDLSLLYPPPEHSTIS